MSEFNVRVGVDVEVGYKCDRSKVRSRKAKMSELNCQRRLRFGEC